MSIEYLRSVSLPLGSVSVTPETADSTTKIATTAFVKNQDYVTQAEAANYSTTIGGAEIITVNHGLGSQNIVVSLWETTSPYNQVFVNTQIIDDNNIRILFNQIPAANSIKVVVAGNPGGSGVGGAVFSVNTQTGDVVLTAANVGALATGVVGSPSGVAGLDANTKVPTTQLPIGTANGVAGLDATSKVPLAQLPTQAQAYDMAGFFQGKPTASSSVFYVPVVRAFSLPASLTGSMARARVAALASTTFNIYKSGTLIGTMVFAAGATTGTFTAASQTSFAAGNILQVTAPATPDTNLADIGFTFAGTLA